MTTRRPSNVLDLAVPPVSVPAVDMRAMLLITVLVLVPGCVAGTGSADFACTLGDFTAVVAGNDPQRQRVLSEVLEQDWLGDAVQCEAGAYTLLAPRDRSRNQYILLRDGSLPEVVRLGAENVGVMDDYYLHVTLTDRNKDGHADSVGYSTWRYHGDLYVDAEDFNLDGQPDRRSTETEDGGTKREAWVNDRWQEIIFENGLRLAEAPETRLRRASDGTFEIGEPEGP